MDAQVEKSLLRRALGFSYTAEKVMVVDGKPTVVPYTEHCLPSDVACFFWLQNRAPDRWRNVQRHEFGRPGEFDRLTDDELLREIVEEARDLGLMIDVTPPKSANGKGNGSAI